MERSFEPKPFFNSPSECARNMDFTPDPLKHFKFLPRVFVVEAKMAVIPTELVVTLS